MQFHTIQPLHARRRSVQVGRGGKRGKTSGRGGKGQTARAGHKIRPEWRDIIKKLPKLRGRGKHGLKSIAEKPITLSLALLTKAFPRDSSVTKEALRAAGLIRKSDMMRSIKVLGAGETDVRLSLSGIGASARVRRAIERGGGTIQE